MLLTNTTQELRHCWHVVATTDELGDEPLGVLLGRVLPGQRQVLLANLVVARVGVVGRERLAAACLVVLGIGLLKLAG